jgi:glutaconate CoA-transferase subunit B
VSGEVDAVGSVGYNSARLAKGWTLEETTDIRFIFTNLCVMDFGGPSHQVRLVSLHPGVTAVQVKEATGFPIHVPENVGVTPDPTPEQLALLAQLDPHNLRATAMGA